MTNLKYFTQKIAALLLIVLMPWSASANVICGAAHGKAAVSKAYHFEGDNGWKFVRITIEKKEASNSQFDVIKIENKPGTSPMFGKDYIFTNSLAQTQEAYKNVREPHLIVESRLEPVGDGFVLEADGFRFKISISRGELRLVPVRISSGMALPETILRQRSTGPG